MTKIYPVQHLALGTQFQPGAVESAADLGTLYSRMHNFHKIVDGIAIDDATTSASGASGAVSAASVATSAVTIVDPKSKEAFTTTMFGKVPDFDHMSTFLEFLATNASGGFQYEYEEEVLSIVISSVGDPCATETIELDLVSNSYSPDPIRAAIAERNVRMKCLEKYDSHLINAGVEMLELHHGFDIPKAEGETGLPIDLDDLHTAVNSGSASGVFDLGAWFVFEKEDRWAYRSNEFHDIDYAKGRARLSTQQVQLRRILRTLLPADRHTRTPLKSSIEIVHRIWNF